MRAWIAIAIVAVIAGDAGAKPRRHPRHRDRAKPVPAAPAPAPAPAPEPAPPPEPVADPPPPPPAAPAPAATAPTPIEPPSATPKAPKGHAFLDDMDCSGCHTPDGWKLSAAAGASGFDHDRTGFALRGAHEAATCLACHDGRKQLSRECASCHVDDHRGRNGAACAECHLATDWKDTQVLARHARTRMPLTGAHALIDCSGCHRRNERRWSDLPSDCNACHAKDYDAPTTHPSHADPTDPVTHAPLPPFPRACAQCHNTVTWSSAVIASSMTAALTVDHDARFAITSGKHRAAPCESCHLDLAQPARVACTGCHAHDPITLVAQHKTIATGASASTCLGCHPGGAAR